MKYDFVSIGDVTTDAFIKLKDAHIEEEKYGKEICMRFGDKIPYEEVEIIHGVGNAGNAAVCAARLGLNAALITNIGTDDNGSRALEVWQKDGVDTSLVKRHAEWPTHYHFVLRFGAERTILIKHQPWPYVLPSFEEPPSWIYFTSTGEHGEPYHHEIAKYLSEHPETKLAFQPGTFQIELMVQNKISDLYPHIEAFFCNKEEAQRILGITESDEKTLLEKMRALGMKQVFITDGPNGAYAMNNEGAWKVPMYPDPKPPISRTGAGDAFASTVVSFLAQGMTLQNTLIRAPINSMNVVQYVGAQTGLLSLSKIEDLLARAPIKYKSEKL